MFRAFIFDIDGTLIDSNAAHAETFVRAFEKYGKKADFDAVKCLIGMGADKILKRFLTKAEIEKFGDELKEYRKELFLEEYLSGVKVFFRVRELFEKINDNGQKIVLATSAGDQEVNRYLEKLNVSHLIKDETSADDAEESKPAPDIFQAAFDKLENIEKSEALIIGDTIYDARAAVRSGIRMIGVTSGGWDREKLYSEGCLKVYRDVAEIYDRYNELDELVKNFQTSGTRGV